jgi:hypothetical protein
LPWQLFAYALAQSSNSVVANKGLVSKVYFPRLIVPLAAVLSGLVDFAIAFAVLFTVMLYYGIVPGLALVVIPFAILLAVMTALAVGLWLSALNVKYRDVQYTIPFLSQFWLFVTPIAYPPASSRAVPRALRPQSDGGRRRVLPLGAVRPPERSLSMIAVSSSSSSCRSSAVWPTSARSRRPSPIWCESVANVAIEAGACRSATRSGAASATDRCVSRSATLCAARSSGGAERRGATRCGRSRTSSFDINERQAVGSSAERRRQEHAPQDPVAHHGPDGRQVIINGRVGSLLEVGTGFHPELSGRDNIYLNGALLGMQRARSRGSSTRSSRSPSRAVHRHAREALLERACTCGWRSPSRAPRAGDPRSSTRSWRSGTRPSRRSASAR